ncbi:alpha/beta fold hydrolase [Acetobacter vaccinii]|nr:alpha/beta fold hydrolase [Acetobacter vaccinii]
MVAGHHLVRVAGHELAVRIAGPAEGQVQAEPLLLIHGFGGSKESWQLILPALSQTRRVISFDLPGHGASSCAVGDGSLHTLAETVSGLMAELGLGRAHILAHSLGGGIALALLAQQPAVLQSLCLLAPVGLGSRVAMDFVGALPDVRSAEAMQQLMAMATFAPRVGRRAAQALVQGLDRPGVRSALRHIVQACFTAEGDTADFQPVLGQAGVPVRLVWGAEDRIVLCPPALTGQAILLPQTGHLPQLEQPESVVQSVNSFLAGPGPG